MAKILKKVQLSADPTKGTQENPYSQEEFAAVPEGTWKEVAMWRVLDMLHLQIEDLIQILGMYYIQEYMSMQEDSRLFTIQEQSLPFGGLLAIQVMLIYLGIQTGLKVIYMLMWYHVHQIIWLYIGRKLVMVYTKLQLH